MEGVCEVQMLSSLAQSHCKPFQLYCPVPTYTKTYTWTNTHTQTQKSDRFYLGKLVNI